MSGVQDSPAFIEVGRKISQHTLEIPIDLKEIEIEAAEKDEANDGNATENKTPGSTSGCLCAGHSAFETWRSKHRRGRKTASLIILNVLVIVYLTFAGLYWSQNNTDCDYEWCSGFGMLLLIVGFVYCGVLYHFIAKSYFGKAIKRCFRPVKDFFRDLGRKRYVSCAAKTTFYAILLAAVVVFLVLDTVDSRNRLISGLGVVVLIGMGWTFSKSPTRVNWTPVISGLILQFAFGLFTIKWSIGRAIFQCGADKITAFFKFVDSGTMFIFGEKLVTDGVFAFSVLPIIFFFSFCVQLLYYIGVMQWIIGKFGSFLHAAMGTTVCESLNAAANTFLGMTESPLLIKPYIGKLTASEIHAVMCSGFATVSGSVLAAYIGFGADPVHLITASVMSAPAALCYAKLLYPETEKSLTSFKNITLQKSDDTSILDAASKGALAAIPMVLGIVANIIAFISFVTFLNAILSWFGGLVGYPALTIQWILSKAFMPLSWVMGVPWEECEYVGELVGLKTIINEFVAYQQLGIYKKAGFLSPRTEAIATYAVCGFSNPGAIGVTIGALSTMCPEKRDLITAVAFRAFVGGVAVCLLTASIAGMLMDDGFLVETPPMINSTLLQLP